MKKIVLILSALFVFMIFFSHAKAQNTNFYKKSWSNVDSLMSRSLPRSANKTVDIIYQKATSENNQDQILKCYIYFFKTNNYKENYFDSLVYKMEVDLKNTPFPNNAVMHSMLAQLYWQYYQSHTWEISNRTELADVIPEDIQTWTGENFIQTIIYHYNASLDSADALKQVPIDFYTELIAKNSKPKELRPILYDFLAARAIDFYSNTEASITRPLDYFQINDKTYFKPINEFVNADFNSSDTLSLHFNGIKILQEWLKFRISNSSEISALIDADLKRILFVYNFSVNLNKDELYFNALQTLSAKYPNAPQTGYVKLKIADFYYNQASKYSPDNATTIKYKNYYVTAKNLYQEIIKKYKDNQEIWKAAQAQIYLIESKNITFQVEEVTPSNSPFAVKLDYKNINKVYFEVRQIDYDDYAKLNYDYDYDEFFKKLRRNYPLVKNYNYNLSGTEDYNSHSTEFIFDGLTTGGYVILASSTPDFDGDVHISHSFMQISDLSLIHQELPDGSIECYVLNRKNGAPLQGVNVKALFNKYSYTLRKYVTRTYGNYVSNAEGYFIIHPRNSDWEAVYFQLFNNNDSLTITNQTYIYKKDIYTSTSPQISFFTDRKIYRPGQTVYFKGIVLNNPTEDVREIIADYSTEVIFYDVNWQVISKQTLISNEFGSFNGSFQIPTGLLNGTMQIYTSYGTTSIQVEEYKRPTFYAEMLPVTQQFLVNDSVIVTGKAENYSGVKVSDANVQYTITRKNIWFGWWWWNYPTQEVMISHGVTKTNDIGEFELNFKAIPDLQMPVNQNTAFSYFITVDVTDINGETQSTSSVINVGYAAMQIKSTISDKISVKQVQTDNEITIIAQNLNGQDVDAQGTIAVYSLKQPSTPLRNRYWEKPDMPFYDQTQWYANFGGNEYKDEADFRFWEKDTEVWTKNFNTANAKKVEITKFKNLTPGVYKMIISTKDAFGNDVINEQFFILYSETESKIPYLTNNWFVSPKSVYQPGETAKFIIGAAYETNVIYQIYIGNELIEKKIIKLNNNQQIIEVPVTEKMRGGFTFSYISQSQNRIFTNKAHIVVPFTNKKLDFEFTSFRDKLQPGQNEEWQITIKDKSGDFALAELMTTLYDASLDAIIPNYWSFYPHGSNSNSIYWNYSTFSFETSNNWKSYDDPYIYAPNYAYPELNWFAYYYYYYGGYRNDRMAIYEDFDIADGIATPVMQKTVSYSNTIEKEQDISGSADLPTGGQQPPAPPSQNDQDKQTQDVQIRKNFNETAFFYPNLKTNAKGEVVISFTIPESLTEWRFLGLAHTKDLKFGLFDKSVITQKEVMVMPNAPRFLRQNDTMFFAAKIANLSDQDLSGQVSLIFIDEISGDTINIFADGEQSTKTFNVAEGLNTPVSWQIIIPDNAKMLTYRIVAKAGNYSDGEQKPLPVLSNRILVTEALPLPIRANRTKNFTFTKLVNSASSTTIKHERITVEFTSNPAWYAIQALPYMIEYPYECSEQTFARYYANTIASYVANSSPKIKAVFDTWKNYQPSALLSNLEKNQELKQLVLEETPWVLDAQDENERKQRIALLFDLNRMANEQQLALAKLKKDQTINGGWPWFKGMPESWYITQYIAEGIGHLGKLNVINQTDNTDIFNMAKRAIKFTDGEMKDSYDYIQQYYTAAQIEIYHPGQMIIHYLYTRSFFDFDLQNKYKTPKDYFYNQLKKYWVDYDLHSQGLLALIFYRNGDETLAAQIIESLDERAIYHNELGMYWTENVSGYYWYQQPIETQSLMIEVFNEVAKDSTKVDELKIWLLKNKQTNDWKTTTATAEAVYALLLTGGVDLLANSQICPVTIGNITIDPQNNPNIQAEAGTGYYKVAFTGSDISPDMGNITVKNNNNIVAWGAIYWQYWEDLDKITPHETPLQLKKDLYKEIVTDRGEQLVLIDANTKLDIGDKIIVRIELRVDRDLEFVHMKDMRASSFEPINIISQYKWQDGLGYYETTKDASTNFFFDFLRKGTYVFEYPLRVSTAGSFSNGITTIQCMYAPEFMSHSQGQRVYINQQ